MQVNYTCASTGTTLGLVVKVNTFEQNVNVRQGEYSVCIVQLSVTARDGAAKAAAILRQVPPGQCSPSGHLRRFAMAATYIEPLQVDNLDLEFVAVNGTVVQDLDLLPVSWHGCCLTA